MSGKKISSVLIAGRNWRAIDISRSGGSWHACQRRLDRKCPPTRGHDPTGFRGDARHDSEPDWRKAAAEKFKATDATLELRLEAQQDGSGERQAAITAIAIQER